MTFQEDIILNYIITFRLCALCTGKIPIGRCTAGDPYYGYDGAFRCLMEAGEVAFLRHSTVNEMLQTTEYSEYFVEHI